MKHGRQIGLDLLEDQVDLLGADVGPRHVSQERGTRDAKDEDLPEDGDHGERRFVATELWTQAQDQPRDDVQVATHEAIEKDVEGLGRRLLLAQDQLCPGFCMRIGKHARHAFNESHEQGDAFLMLQRRQRTVVLKLSQIGLDRADGCADTRLNLLADELEDRQIEPFLAAEVVADQGLIGARAARDLACTGRMKAIAGEFGNGGFDERATRGITPVAAF